MRGAEAERAEKGRPPVQYVVVLTKIDKATPKQLSASRRDVLAAFSSPAAAVGGPLAPSPGVAPHTDTGGDEEDYLAACADDPEPREASQGDISALKPGAPRVVRIVESSASTREGRDDLWRTVLELLRDRHRM